MVDGDERGNRDRSREEAARKGGVKVSENREHMREIGRKGGERVAANREHMSEIGRKGAEKRNRGR
jgi:general stress protein YciG